MDRTLVFFSVDYLSPNTLGAQFICAWLRMEGGEDSGCREINITSYNLSFHAPPPTSYIRLSHFIHSWEGRHLSLAMEQNRCVFFYFPKSTQAILFNLQLYHY